MESNPGVKIHAKIITCTLQFRPVRWKLLMQFLQRAGILVACVHPVKESVRVTKS